MPRNFPAFFVCAVAAVCISAFGQGTGGGGGTTGGGPGGTGATRPASEADAASQPASTGMHSRHATHRGSGAASSPARTGASSPIDKTGGQ